MIYLTGATQISGSQGTDGELDSYTPNNDWNIDASQVQLKTVVESSTMTPIGGSFSLILRE